MVSVSSIEPLGPWADIFTEGSRQTLAIGEDLFVPGSVADRVYLLEEGAIVETRSEKEGASHAVGLLGPGSIIGARMTSAGGGLHEVRATALVPSTVRSIERDSFLHEALKHPELSSALLRDLAHRTEIARRLTDSCHQTSTGRHVLDLLQVVETTFDGVPGHEVSVPMALLERMSGCPWVMVRRALGELREQGLVEVNASSVRLRHPQHS